MSEVVLLVLVCTTRKKKRKDSCVCVCGILNQFQTESGDERKKENLCTATVRSSVLGAGQGESSMWQSMYRRLSEAHVDKEKRNGCVWVCWGRGGND